MDQLISFLEKFGLPITLIALGGIVILGLMKQLKIFDKLEESTRHYVYIAISVGVSVIGAVIYLSIIKQFTIEYILTISSAILALNQTAYNVFKITPVNEVVSKLFTKLLDLLFSKNSKQN